MEDTGTVVAFYVLAVLTVGSALAVAAVRNLIHAVVAMVAAFAGVAGLYVTLSADFLAVVQLLIYAGAISILMVFAILLTPRARRDNAETFLFLPAVALAGLLGVIMVFAALDTDWAIAGREGFRETASAIGSALLDKYVLPFEIASGVLLVAMLGAILLVRPEGVGEKAEE